MLYFKQFRITRCGFQQIHNWILSAAIFANCFKRFYHEIANCQAPFKRKTLMFTCFIPFLLKSISYVETKYLEKLSSVFFVASWKGYTSFLHFLHGTDNKTSGTAFINCSRFFCVFDIKKEKKVKTKLI